MGEFQYLAIAFILMVAGIMGLLALRDKRHDAEDEELSPLVQHARYELALIDEDPDVIEMYVRVMKAFMSYGHSGGSHSVAVPVINQLLNFKNISPLTENPEEWEFRDADMWGEEGGIWQNKRNSEAFSGDGGKTYYLLSERGAGQNIMHASERSI